MTIGAALRQTARRFADRDAIVFPQAGVRLTWAEFDRAVDRLARGLLAIGLRRGDHFGVWSTNWPQWVLLQFATARIGVILVTINPAYRAAELEFTLAQSEVRGLALIERHRSNAYFDLLREACPELDSARPGELRSARFPHLQWVVRIRGREHPGMLAWQDLEAAGEGIAPQRLEEAERQLGPGDPINLQYTSGTTGLPKGVLLSHRNLLLNAFYAAEHQRLAAEDRICISVPLYHCFGCVLGTMCAAVSGAAMVFPQESFDAEATLRAVESERCTAIYGVPTMFIAELEHPSFRQRDTSSLRTGIMAGSPCPIELMKRVVHEMGAREITIAYGQTETSPLITMTSTDDPIEKRVGTVGRPFPGIEVKIVDPLSGEELADGRSGELCCRGHDVMLGYYQHAGGHGPSDRRRGLATHRGFGPAAAGRLLPHHRADQGNDHPRGRKHRPPRDRGVALPTSEGGTGVGRRRARSEVRRRDPGMGQAARGQSATADEIRDFCRLHLAHFKTPRYIQFVDSFPTTVTGKIQKYKIRQQAIEELGLQEAEAIETA